MKAIILAAGRGTRLKPITNTTPKPLIKIFGKTILEHNLEAIYKDVSEIIIVIKYKQELFKEYLGNNYKNTPISYHLQSEKKGTGAALFGLNIQEDILVLNGDSIFQKEDIQNFINKKGYGALAKTVNEPEKYGIFQIENNFAKKIIEKPSTPVGNLANVGVYKFSKELFTIIKTIPLSPRNEYEITDAINKFIENNDFFIQELQGDFIDIGYPWDILSANNHFLDNLKNSSLEGDIEEGVTIKGNIVLENGAVLKSGTYIEGNVFIGKNSIIGPNTYLRSRTVIGENCKIGNAVELKNVTLGDNSNVAHLSYLGDSIVGNNVNIGGGMITANLRHDNANIRCKVKGELVDTNRRKLGVIIGDNVKTGINTMTMPGRVIENDSFTLPGEMVK